MENQPQNNHSSRKFWNIATIVLLVLAAFGYGGYSYYKLDKENKANEATIVDLKTKLATTEGSLASAQTINQELNAKLVHEQDINNGFTSQLGQITSNVGTLIKLSQTDKELLQKYSKIYFLNENYTPSNLSEIDAKYLSDPKKPQQFHTNALPFLNKLLAAANADNKNIQVVSAFRSFGTQTALKQNYKLTYGSGANAFSADQGYSEHQLGTAIDFTVPSVSQSLDGFDKDPAFDWLNKNAYKYGFILSYPKQNTYYQFEPWHWRFVGVALATKIHNDNTLFYYLDQRDIDKYLVNIFD
jgi:D-alanyl-D-alanine carboxypeptidase